MRRVLMIGLFALTACGGDAKPGSLKAEVKETAESLSEAVGEVADKAGATTKEIADDLKDAPDEASRNFKKNFQGEPPAQAPASEAPKASAP